MKELENIKELAKKLNIDNVDQIFKNVDKVLDSRNSQESRNDEIKLDIEKLDPDCEFVPFLPQTALKKAICDLFGDLDKNGKQYNISDIQDEISNGDNDSFENINLSESDLFTSDNCIKSIHALVNKFIEINKEVFDIEEQKSKLFDNYFYQTLHLNILVTKLAFVEGSSDNVEKYNNNLESTYENYKKLKNFYENNVLSIHDFITYDTPKKNNWNKRISNDTVLKTKNYFKVDLKKYHFDRSDDNYLNKRKKIIDVVEKSLSDLRKKLLDIAHIKGLFEENKLFEETSNYLGRVNELKSSIKIYKETEDYLNFVPTYLKLESKIKKLKHHQTKLQTKLETFKCDDGIPDQVSSFEPGDSTHQAPIIVSNNKNSHTPIDKNYWDIWSTIATVVNLTQPPSFWPIGIVIPTPSGLIKIPMPILWQCITVIPNPGYLIVIFLGMCGICPSPFVFMMDFKQKATRFLLSMRGPQTIRNVNETTSKIDDKIINSNTNNFGEYATNGDFLQNVALVEDDLPDFSRLNLKNIPFLFKNAKRKGMMTAFNLAGKSGGGFFENV